MVLYVNLALQTLLYSARFVLSMHQLFVSLHALDMYFVPNAPPPLKKKKTKKQSNNILQSKVYMKHRPNGSFMVFFALANC